MMPAPAAFAPSAHGFRFKNDWPHVSAFTVPVGGIDVPVGDAAKGLCGGMVFAARDYFGQGLPVPPDVSAPPTGPLYEFIGARLKDSFGAPLGLLKYMDLMAASDGDTGLAALRWLIGKRWRGIAWRTIRDELPVITDEIDRHHLACLGLICIHSIRPADLGENHQVLAYRYERTGDRLRLWVYDPNRPLRDDVYLELSSAHPSTATPIEFVNGSMDVRGFFHVPYAGKQPPT